MRPWRMGSEFLWQCKKGVLNYVIARPLVTAIALLTDHWGYYGQGNIDFGRSYVYLTAITNFSQASAVFARSLLSVLCKTLACVCGTCSLLPLTALLCWRCSADAVPSLICAYRGLYCSQFPSRLNGLLQLAAKCSQTAYFRPQMWALQCFQFPLQ